MEGTVAGVRERKGPGLPGEPGRRALYFCGSIRGGREDRELYGRIVSRLRRFGTVLTEHVAAAELEAHGEAAGARGAGLGLPGAGGVGPTPLHRNCPSPRKWGPESDRLCLRTAALRAQSPHSVVISAFGSFLENFLSSFQGAFAGRAE